MIDLTGDSPLLSMRGIDKQFPGVHALRDIDLDLYKGEVLALMGENGAGKSTLIKMLGGAHQPTKGEIFIDGASIDINTPHDAQSAGIGIIYQEFNLVPHLTVSENIFLGKAKSTWGFVRKNQEHAIAKSLFAKIGIEIDPGAICSTLSTAQQQIVEIAKALSSDVRFLVMDEPSASLTPQEVTGLFKIIADLKSHGIAIIYISHRLDEIFEIADRIMVLRDGQGVGVKSKDDITRQEMITMMVGRKIEDEFPKHYHDVGEVVLEVNQLNAPNVKSVSFKLRAGEVLGFTGLVGAGRTETARLIFGADSKASGEIKIKGRAVNIGSPIDAIKLGICLLTEDRKGQGLVLMHSVKDNFALPNLDAFSTVGFLKQNAESKALNQYIESIDIKVSSPSQLAQNLSGGNQQKVVLAKWLQKNCDIIIIDEPTRGIDVGAKYEIYMLINDLAKAGKAIMMISSELPEILGMSDRVIVMRNGEITAEVTDVNNATQEQLLENAIH